MLLPPGEVLLPAETSPVGRGHVTHLSISQPHTPLVTAEADGGILISLVSFLSAKISRKLVLLNQICLVSKKRIFLQYYIG